MLGNYGTVNFDPFPGLVGIQVDGAWVKRARSLGGNVPFPWRSTGFMDVWMSAASHRESAVSNHGETAEIRGRISSPFWLVGALCPPFLFWTLAGLGLWMSSHIGRIWTSGEGGVASLWVGNCRRAMQGGAWLGAGAMAALGE